MNFDTSCEVIFFASSSGHCTLDCQYCIVNPIAKNQPSLTYEDLKFLLDTFKVRAFFSFSGLGDFFAGYKPSQKLLTRLLDHDVEVALDVNGVLIHDFPALEDRKLEKIRYLNLSMHYHQINQKNLLSQWAKNARTLIENRFKEIHPDYVLSPPLIKEWETALEYYKENVFVYTRKPLLLVRNINIVFDESAEAHIRQLITRFGDVIAGTHQEDFAAGFANRPKVLCPAGVSYFRLWNDGRVQGCPQIPALYDCGNVKDRNLKPKQSYFLCDSPQYCDCHVIDALGKMRLPV
jgi:hypothetical protein